MSGDIEDFLRRAAQRRQARQGNKPQAPPQRRRPEYTDARRERLPSRPAEDDDLVVAEVVEEPMGRKLAELRRAQEQAMREAAAAAETRRVSERVADHSLTPRVDSNARTGRGDVPVTPLAGGLAKPSVTDATEPPDEFVDPLTLEELRESLLTPHGLRNAVLMREILDRPEHRW